MLVIDLRYHQWWSPKQHPGMGLSVKSHLGTCNGRSTCHATKKTSNHMKNKYLYDPIWLADPIRPSRAEKREKGPGICSNAPAKPKHLEWFRLPGLDGWFQDCSWFRFDSNTIFAKIIEHPRTVVIEETHRLIDWKSGCQSPKRLPAKTVHVLIAHMTIGIIMKRHSPRQSIARIYENQRNNSLEIYENQQFTRKPRKWWCLPQTTEPVFEFRTWHLRRITLEASCSQQEHCCCRFGLLAVVITFEVLIMLWIIVVLDVVVTAVFVCAASSYLA